MENLSNISFPMEETNEEVQKQLMEKIKKGIYHNGNLIVPQKYEKVILKNGQLLNEEILVSGRKIPLRTIRTAMLQKQEKYMRVRTDAEFNNMSREQQLYMLARCQSTDNQLLCSEERVEGLLEINTPITSSNGVPINDVMRIFKVDDPAAQLEAGHQKGGDNFCWLCPTEVAATKNIILSLKQPLLSLQDRVSKVLMSPGACSRIVKGNIKLFSMLSKTELVEQLLQRSIKYTCQSITKELQGLLDCEMHGIQRLPAVLFNNHALALKDINLENYEILKNEPLHDVSNQIKNLYEEMPNHVPKDMRSSFKKIISASYNGKELKKGADHGESLVYVCKWLMNILLDHFSTTIFSAILEIQEMLYSPDKKRNCILILHLYLRTFVFSIMIKIHLQGKLKTITERKFFGTYYHPLTRHAAEQYKLFSGRSTNTEKEEATFNKIKFYTNLTSDHHPENVILNAVIRLQVNKEFSQKPISKENNLSHIYHPIKEHSLMQ